MKVVALYDIHAVPWALEAVLAEVEADAIVAETFAGTTGTVMIGHTHHQFDRQIGDLRIVNAGSVGMPYEGEVAAFWTLVVDGEPEFRKTPFDIDRAVRELRASGWPQVEEFIEENVLQAVSREEAIAAQEARR